MRRQPKGRVSESKIRVRYAETDAMGIVHHSRYIPWFEVGRVNLLREVGLPYGDIEAMGFLFLITELGVRYYRPAHFDEVVTVRTWVDKVYSRGMRLEYEVVNEAGERLVTAYTKFISVDREGRPVRLPQRLIEILSEEREPA
ncbi:MAG: acyl-CoA thioesterase [Caldilineae bacterium]|nr:MAG: acyl-CoA thioesterase [Caldilineae bacterium]